MTDPRANGDLVATQTKWRPAHHCANAIHTLRWDEPSMSWILARQHNGRTHRVATLHGYPLDQPPVDDQKALKWADQILTLLGAGPQEWINHPTPSTAWHTHGPSEPPAGCPMRIPTGQPLKANEFLALLDSTGRLETPYIPEVHDDDETDEETTPDTA